MIAGFSSPRRAPEFLRLLKYRHLCARTGKSIGYGSSAIPPPTTTNCDMIPLCALQRQTKRRLVSCVREEDWI
jgi:hypothetical protein